MSKSLVKFQYTWSSNLVRFCPLAIRSSTLNTLWMMRINIGIKGRTATLILKSLSPIFDWIIFPRKLTPPYMFEQKYGKMMTNTDTFFSWVPVRRSVTAISSTIELCSTLLILKVCYNVRIFCTVICLQTCQSLFWT